MHADFSLNENVERINIQRRFISLRELEQQKLLMYSFNWKNSGVKKLLYTPKAQQKHIHA